MSVAIILLTVTWCALTRDAGPLNVLLGLALSVPAVRFVGRPAWPRRLLARLPAVISLGLFFTWEMLLSNLRMVRVVLAPGRHLRPAIIEVEVEVESDTELAVLSNLVTLTPGTLGLDVSADSKRIYVHILTDDDASTVRSDIQTGLARRVRKVFAC